MAGDWLKFEKATPDKPEVFAIAAKLDMDPDAVVGKLIRVWSWFDTHTVDGNGRSVTAALLDRISGVSGFVTAMASVGWVAVTDEGVSLPNFDRHTGETAKGRALTAKRVAKHKGKGNGTTNAASVTPALPREEKRREEQEPKAKGIATQSLKPTATPPLPGWVPVAAWADWHAYRNSRKGWTAGARKLSLRTLTNLYEAGQDPTAVIEQSIESGWTKLYPVKSQGSNNANPAKLSAAERVLAHAIEGERADRDRDSAGAYGRPYLVGSDG